ncbi:MAG: IS110 family transposase [Gammaproteobacteria bacterium]|nr:IS110 family transposase [Gammaproteobacteria bacterium]
MNKTTIGVDVSKDTLDAVRYPQGDHLHFSNDATGFRAFMTWLGTEPIERIVFEATGHYHRAFERAIDQAGLPMAKVNPLHAKRFTQALGALSKTDRIDAGLLARLGMALKPQTKPAAPQIMWDLKELHVARTALIKARTAVKNRQKNLTLPLLKRQANQQLKQIEAQLKQIDKAMLELIKTDQHLATRLDILISIPGLATLSACALIIDMPELGTLDNQTAASLSGTAPRTRQSGKWKGKTFVHGGRPNVRKALYMPALVASRFNHDMTRKYDTLIKKGKPPKVALTAIMRKLIILANALLRDGRKWQPNQA